jgi:hypothetical protein
MRAKLLTLLLSLVFSIAMVASADAMDSIGTLGHINPGDHGKTDDHGKPGEFGKPDDHGKPGEFGKPDDHGKPGDFGKPDDHGKPGDFGKRDDHGRGTVIVTVVGPMGRPASGASVTMDGKLVGSTNLQGKLTIPNVISGDHRISAAKTSWRESLRGSSQIKVRGKQTIQTSIKLTGGWR